ncbi:MAG: Formyl-CoA transferase [Rhizobacter sp.]|nr:Formyl-CoA transferase [Rhizobacter sp.]
MTHSCFPDPASNPGTGGGALEGLRVIDMTQMLAGPYASMLLADHGAEVIKIEPLAGDYVRGIGPFREDDALRVYGGYFQSVNRNKLSVSIDLKSPRGRQIVLDLVKSADVLVENFRSGVMDRLGLSYETLAAINPRLVYGAVRGYGDPRTGSSPQVDWPAYDVIAQAMGGVMGITGADPHSPMKVGPGVGDIVPAMFCAFGVLAAVYRAQRTGQGQFVDVSMVDSVLALCERIVYQYAYQGKVAGPEGNRHPFLTPFGIVPCRDGHIALACHTDAFWASLCSLMGRPELAADARFQTEEARRSNAPATYEVVAEFTLPRSKRELVEILGGKIPFGPIYTIEDIRESPHFAARGMIVEVDHPGVPQPVEIAGVPVHMTATPGGVRRRAPLLSEHAPQVLAGIGIDADELASLRAAGVVG